MASEVQRLSPTVVDRGDVRPFATMLPDTMGGFVSLDDHDRVVAEARELLSSVGKTHCAWLDDRIDTWLEKTK